MASNHSTHSLSEAAVLVCFVVKTVESQSEGHLTLYDIILEAKFLITFVTDRASIYFPYVKVQFHAIN